jgi:predicted  nucleic acid-binding Zn-ribbon protein
MSKQSESLVARRKELKATLADKQKKKKELEEQISNIEQEIEKLEQKLAS